MTEETQTQPESAESSAETGIPVVSTPSNQVRWQTENQVAVVQGPTLAQIVGRYNGPDKAAAYVLKYGEGKGFSFRAAFVNPAKKSHVILGPLMPVGDDGKPDPAAISAEEWASVDLSPFEAAPPTATLAGANPRPARAPATPRPPRAPKPPREPRLSGVAPLAMIQEGADLYTFLRLAENTERYFVNNPNRKRSIRWDFALTEANLAEFQALTGQPFPLEKLTKATENGEAVVKTRFSRYDLTVEAGENGSVLHVEKYRSDTAAPPPARPDRVAPSAPTAPSAPETPENGAEAAPEVLESAEAAPESAESAS